MRSILFVCAAWLVGCSAAPVAGDDAGATDAGALDAGITEDAGVADAGSPWDAVIEELERSANADGGAVPLALAVWDESGLRFEHGVNGFTPDTRVPLASASKLIAASTILEAIHRGPLTLQSTTGQILGWTGAYANITLEQLLSFTSGLDPDNLCTFNPNVTLAQCVETIHQEPMVAPPGTRFDYGGSHLHVAGRMVEVALNRTWNDFFDEAVRIPLGLPPEVTFYASPRMDVGRLNPSLAGGMRASMHEYGAILHVIYFKGQTPQLTLATPELFEAQARQPFPSVTIGNSPAEGYGFDFKYGLGTWLECETPATGCARISSAGAFGFTPWLDRENHYWGTLGMQQPAGGVGAYSIPLQQRLQPLIRAALGH